MKKNLLTSKDIEFIKRCMFYFLDDRHTSMDTKRELKNYEYKVHSIDEKLCEINIRFKYLKFGFWRSTDQCCYDIWNNRLSRNDAVKIVTSISDQFPKEYFLDFLNFHKLSKEDFWNTVEKFRNKKIWELVNGEWKLKNPLK